MSVIVGRAVPDVRAGLKPVHRRIFYGMNELGNQSNKPHKKAARIVGEVMGKYHPHGDAAIFDAMVRMAQEWSMRYLLVDGQGNFGNQDGDGPAAMRYIEARLHRQAEYMLEDIEKDTVDFQNNFDDSLKEPTVLPTRIPQLLMNGASGIAVGMATNMMPHNLREVIAGCIAYIEKRDITVEELMVHIKAPDFPTGGIIYGMEGVKAAMHFGRGRVVLRGKLHVDTKASGRESIIVTEVPYQVNRDALCDRIGQLVNEKVVEGIAHVNNESNNKEGTRIVIDLKRDAVANVVINQLYKHSELQTSYAFNNFTLVKGSPRTLNIRDMISEFVEFRHEVVIRRTQFELKEVRADEGMHFDVIKKELNEIKDKFGDERKTEITYLDDEVSIKDLIREEDVVITISHLGYIKRTSATEYRQQRRGGRGAIGGKTRDEDYIQHLFVASTHPTLFFFTG